MAGRNARKSELHPFLARALFILSNWYELERKEFIRGFCFAIRGIYFFAMSDRIQRIPTDGKAEPTDEIPAGGPSNDSGPNGCGWVAEH
jgi:hypothetical protein